MTLLLLQVHRPIGRTPLATSGTTPSLTEANETTGFDSLLLPVRNDYLSGTISKVRWPFSKAQLVESAAGRIDGEAGRIEGESKCVLA
jgi:hypothetical protein